MALENTHIHNSCTSVTGSYLDTGSVGIKQQMVLYTFIPLSGIVTLWLCSVLVLSSNHRLGLYLKVFFLKMVINLLKSSIINPFLLRKCFLHSSEKRRPQMRTGSKEEIKLEVVVSPVVCHTPSNVSSHFSVLSYGLLRHDQRGDSRNWQWKHVHGLKNESVCIHSVKAAVRWLISSRMASKWKCCRWSYVVIGPLQLPSPPGQAIKHVKQNDAILKINCGGPCHRILRGCSRCF